MVAAELLALSPLPSLISCTAGQRVDDALPSADIQAIVRAGKLGQPELGPCGWTMLALGRAPPASAPARSASAAMRCSAGSILCLPCTLEMEGLPAPARAADVHGGDAPSASSSRNGPPTPACSEVRPADARRTHRVGNRAPSTSPNGALPHGEPVAPRGAASARVPSGQEPKSRKHTEVVSPARRKLLAAHRRQAGIECHDVAAPSHTCSYSNARICPPRARGRRMNLADTNPARSCSQSAQTSTVCRESFPRHPCIRLANAPLRFELRILELTPEDHRPRATVASELGEAERVEDVRKCAERDSCVAALDCAQRRSRHARPLCDEGRRQPATQAREPDVVAEVDEQTARRAGVAGTDRLGKMEAIITSIQDTGKNTFHGSQCRRTLRGWLRSRRRGSRRGARPRHPSCRRASSSTCAGRRAATRARPSRSTTTPACSSRTRSARSRRSRSPRPARRGARADRTARRRGIPSRWSYRRSAACGRSGCGAARRNTARTLRTTAGGPSPANLPGECVARDRAVAGRGVRTPLSGIRPSWSGSRTGRSSTPRTAPPQIRPILSYGRLL